ncbi:protein-disulfide reductase DsbD domain-containing protein [Oricola sp.]|uniref:protein-disulfide reductase DsbD domain-containing protein n=1 Tax=Oricola sp. TaxID=1979950 RepID=UPI0025E0D23C|nr:protein-disulfide reductase DsbD domain-containing protein [Oricola sp.]MCI5076781.1 hypothetical protein [Oricola sp.]
MIHLLTKNWPAGFALICAIVPQQVLAASSPWEVTDGARLRMLVEPAEPGRSDMRGLLQIELEPGWKTYWREPGSAGIPPQISIDSDAIEAVEIHYPAPEWSDDAYGSWAGYKQPVALPLTFTLSGGATPQAVAADVFLGICHDVCVPVSVRFEVTPNDGRGHAMQKLLLNAAFDALPRGNTERLAIDSATWTTDGSIEITLHHASAEAEPQLFVSAGSTYPFKKPVRVTSDDSSTTFRIEPAFDPAEAGDLDLLVTARKGIDAVETSLTVPAP